ncbi:hypothetical protein GCM10011594_31430 [Nakamurella endophytica]|uniref:Reverse transcriptase domain-containing protein n=1 Tax=Nakamurella endophytica TaxID=1748367 RepID=A0A917WJA0_9ACTN|nr:hypothetical protein GCM10011594_31430 [Nakamurella endophytica]
MPGGRVTLKTDISQFYPSVYTHAVDWAIRGKQRAKRDLRASGLGPRLDRLLRNSRSGQTIGLSVGPDTSWLIAEVVLARIDRELVAKFPRLTRRCARFGDDMTFYAASYDEAHDVLATYQGLLLDYELALNPTKVAVIDGLDPVEPRWIRRLRAHRYRSDSDTNLATDIVDLFDSAFDERQRFATQGVLSYAIMRCNPFPGGPTSWPLFRDLVLAAAGLEPSTLRHSYEVLRFAKDRGLPVNDDRVAEVMNELLVRHGQLGRGYEVAWILFMMRELDVRLENESAEVVSHVNDACSLVILRDLCEQSPHLRASVDFDQATRRAEAEGALSGSDWLMAYEFRRNKWARPCRWDKSPSWKALHSADVSFYVPMRRMPKPKLRRWKPQFLNAWPYPVR